MSLKSEISSEVQRIEATVKSLISTRDLASGGKLQPAKWPSSRRKKSEPEAPKASEEDEVKKSEAATEEGGSKPLVAEIIKAEERIVTGLVLKPEVVDGQGDIMSAKVIAKAAHDWLAAFNRKTKLGLQHSSFKKNETRFYPIESYVAPIEFVMGTSIVKAGTWVLSVFVADDKIWEAVKKGEITGFSIGGRASAEELKEEDK
jgi:hypothetical protein